MVVREWMRETRMKKKVRQGREVKEGINSEEIRMGDRGGRGNREDKVR